MNEVKDQARVRNTKINVALYNAATDYAEYVMSDRHNYDEAMRLASALEAAAVAYAKIAGGEKPEAVQNAGNIAGSISATLLERIVERMDKMQTEITRRDPALKDEYMRGAKYAVGMCIGIVREETLKEKLRSNTEVSDGADRKDKS